MGLAAALVMVGMVVCYKAGRARASGGPQVNPLTYTGVLLDAKGDATIAGPVNLIIGLYAQPAPPGSPLCQTMASATPLTAGRFQVTLDAMCTDVVHNNPDLYVDVSVNGVSIAPRPKLGSVPYALEADKAAGASGPLATQIAQMQTTLTTLSPIPSGVIQAFAGSQSGIPSGWVECKGQAVGRTDPVYAALFKAIGVTWGAGDQATTFNVPDLRGVFLRGWNGFPAATDAFADPDAASRVARLPAAGVATGNGVGSYQQDQLVSHNHGTTFGGGCGIAFAPGGDCSPAVQGSASMTNFTGGAETRGKNAYVMYIIKL
jgi:hypothetical protein